MSALAAPARFFRSIFGGDTGIERRVNDVRSARARHRERTERNRLKVDRGETWTTYIRKNTLVVRPDEETEAPIGLFLYGGCDLPTVFEAAAHVAPRLHRRLAVFEAPVSLDTAQARMLRQLIDGVPPEHVAETCDVLGVDPGVFGDRIFRPTFHVGGGDHGGTFQKTMTFLSLGAEAIRPLYRHKEHGFVVDPGGLWLDGQISDALGAKETRAWFKANFQKLGRLDLAEFTDLYRTVITAIRERTGSQVAVFNTLTVEPGDHAHNYQLRRLPEAARRRELHVLVAELSAEMDFPIIDVDRALKRTRVERQLDFAHFPTDQYPVIAVEIEQMLEDFGYLD